MILLLILVLLVEPWIVSLIHCEVLTAKYADADMLEAIQAHVAGMMEIDTLKILAHKPYSYCRVYGKSDTSGNEFILTYNFENEQSKWNVVHWDTIWSKQGSADEFIWPYIR